MAEDIKVIITLGRPCAICELIETPGWVYSPLGDATVLCAIHLAEYAWAIEQKGAKVTVNLPSEEL